MTKDDQPGPEEVFSPTPPSEELKMLVSTILVEHDGNDDEDAPIEMGTWDVSRAHLYGYARVSIYTFFSDGHEHVLKNNSKNAVLLSSVTKTELSVDHKLIQNTLVG